MVPLVWQLIGEFAGHDSMTAAASPSRVLKAIREDDMVEEKH